MLKQIKLATFYFMIMGLFLCGRPQSNAITDLNTMENTQVKTDGLTLQIKATHKIDMAYGHVFDGEIVKIVQGDFKSTSINLVILSGANQYLDPIKNHLSPDVIEITFTKLKENEPYQMMPINGFVDQHKTSWEIFEIKTKID